MEHLTLHLQHYRPLIFQQCITDLNPGKRLSTCALSTPTLPKTHSVGAVCIKLPFFITSKISKLQHEHKSYKISPIYFPVKLLIMILQMLNLAEKKLINHQSQLPRLLYILKPKTTTTTKVLSY